jgi:DNA (cytosine-5)-methyltransferase 1
MNQGTKYTYIDLFCGAGGMTEGFEISNKFEGLAHIDWEIPMVRTLRHRLCQLHNLSKEEAQRKVIHMDLQLHDELLHGIKSIKLKDKYKSNHPDFINGGLLGNDRTKGILAGLKVDLVIGGPSCQAYSIAGRAQDEYGMKKDYRNFLFESFVKIVKALKPKIFVFENVPGMLSAKPNDEFVTELVFKAFKQAGYEILNPSEMKDHALIDMSEYGVPQTRKRLIIIGVLAGKASKNSQLKYIYKKINALKKNKKKTVRMTIGRMPKLVPLPSNKRIPRVSHVLNGKNNFCNHNPRFHNNRDVAIFKKWIKGRFNKKSAKVQIAFYNSQKDITKKTKKGTKHGKYRNLEFERPSPTIVAHIHKDGLMFIHPDAKQARSLTVRECARLQTFPDDFQFIEADGSNYKMIGNAVPPEFAKILANVLAKYFSK